MAMTDEDREYANAFNEGEPTTSAPAGGDTGGGIEPPAEAVAAAEAEGGKPAGEGGDPLKAPVSRQGDAPAGDEPEAVHNASEEMAEGDAGTNPIDDSADNGGSATGGAGVDAPAVAIVVDTPAAGDTGTPDVTQDPSAASTDDGEEPTDPKDIQRKKSWEGRLNAREAELKKMAADLEAKAGKDGTTTEEATGDALAEVSSTAEAANPALADEAGQLAGQVDRGEITADEALAQLTEDFGDGFTKLLTAAITGAAQKLIEPMQKELKSAIDGVRADADAVIEHIDNQRLKSHFDTIKAAEPDFMQISKDPAFEAFVAEKGPDAERIRAGGTAEEVIALIKEFKDSKGDGNAAEGEGAGVATAAANTVPPTEGATADEVDDALAVRGGGMSLPAEPKSNNDFASGWDDTPDIRRG